jgi:uncharacterized protein (DUF736 family)
MLVKVINKTMKEFVIFRNENKKGEKEPDYKLSIKAGDKWEEIGGAWLRTSSKGTKFFSCKLSDAYKDVRKGWHLEEDKRTQEEVEGVIF